MSPAKMRPGYQIYENEMINVRHGFPVWYGDPYGGEEIEIGDLGYMNEGAFVCIRRPSTRYDISRAVNRSIDFPTPLYSSVIDEHGFNASIGVQTPLPAGVQGEVSMSTSRNALALLNVATRNADFFSCREGDKSRIGAEFLRNANLWLEEAANTEDGNVGETLTIDKLIMVTGFYKTWNWAATAMSTDSSKGGLSFSVNATSHVDGSISYNWNAVRKVSPFHSIGHKHLPGSVSPGLAPPASVSSRSVSHGSDALQNTTTELFDNCCREHEDVRNQTIFLRGFRIRKMPLKKYLLEELAVHDDRKFYDFLKPYLRTTPNLTGTPGTASGLPAILPNAPMDKVFPQQEGLNILEPIDGLPDPGQPGDCDTLYDVVALVNAKEDQDLVLVHDDEVITLLEKYQSWAELQDPKPLTLGSITSSGRSREGSSGLGSLTSLLANVSSYAQLFYHLLVNRPDLSGPIVETSKPPPTITVPDKTTNPLFALIIGIDAYDQDVGPLRGCVKDATDIRKYLLTDLKVPESQIRFLTDHKAKRRDILAAFHEIKTDSRIKKGDPILIFFAGHGYEIGSSGGTEHKIQLLVPQDYSKNPANQVHGILDATLGLLLEEIANRHGENITVIFDSCYSGSESASRGGRIVRSLTQDQRQRVPAALDGNIWGKLPNPSDHLLRFPPLFSTTGLTDHVVLSACTQKEGAVEGSAGGTFTQALLTAIRSTGVDKLTYISLLERMDKLPSQNPQCQGQNWNHIIFDAKAPPTGRVCFPIKNNGMAYKMQAGFAHGITQGAEFSLYDNSLTIDESTPLALLVVTDIGPFASALQIKQPSSALIPLLPDTACGLQTKAGEAEYFLLYVPLDDKFIKLYETLATMMMEPFPGEGQIRPVLEREKARLGLSVVDDKVAFDVFDPFLAGYGLTRVPYTVKNDPNEIIPVLHGAAHYYWNLNQEAKDFPFLDLEVLDEGRGAQSVHEYIDIEFNTLLPNKVYDYSTRTPWKPTGENLFQLGVIDIVASDEVGYGFKITNRSRCDLYINAFYFNNTDFSIESYYQPPKSSHFDNYAPLPKNGGHLTIGYGARGDTPKIYQLGDDVNIDVGYLLFCIDVMNEDLSSIPQQTPFESSGRKSVSKKVPPQPTYTTILVPIINRRTAVIQG